MTEKEKLKEIIETELGFHDCYKVVVTEKDIDRLVDKLIENGYGYVKTREENCNVCHFELLSDGTPNISYNTENLMSRLNLDDRVIITHTGDLGKVIRLYPFNNSYWADVFTEDNEIYPAPVTAFRKIKE